MSAGVDINGIGSLDTKKLIEAHEMVAEVTTENKELLTEIKALLQEIKEVLQSQ